MIDLDIARANIPGDDRDVRQMAGLLHSESERLMLEMRQSFSANDPETFQRAAHTLKSAARIFGARPIVEEASRLEALGKSGDISGPRANIDKLAKLVDRLTAALREFLAAEDAQHKSS